MKTARAGLRTVEMNYLPDVHVIANRAVERDLTEKLLKFGIKERAFDVLDMTIDEAHEFFDAYPKLKKIISTLKDVDLATSV